MPDRTPRLPKYRHYKPKNLAVVRIDGRDIYLGQFESAASREKYRRVVAEWLISTKPSTSSANSPAEMLSPTVAEMILTFWSRHAERHYRHADGTPTGELDNYRDSLRPLRRLYGQTLARDFGPRTLRLVRQAMIDDGLARTTINQRIGRIVHLFKWAAEHELVPADTYHGLKTVSGLRKGRSEARETEPVKPAPEADVEAVRSFVARQVWAMIELQRFTGMRSGEVTSLRTGDLETSGRVWTYVPGRHKTTHRGQERTIYLGPRAQAVLKPWLRADRQAYLFSPKEAVAERQAERRRQRRTPMTPSQQARQRKGTPGRPPGECYTTQTYHHAVQRGCQRAGVPPWHPHQLRHTRATTIRQVYGLKAAKAVLGHTDTKIDPEKDLGLVTRIMGEIG